MGKTAREILIREAEEKDVSAIYDIGCLCFSDAWRRETVHHDLMENEHSFYLVAEEDGFITGYGCFWFIAGEAQLVNIGVRHAAGVRASDVCSFERASKKLGAVVCRRCFSKSE